MRVEGWERILAEAVEAARERPFVVGVHDCATWAAEVAGALQGRDLADWRGRVKTEKGALREMRRRGFATLAEAVTAVLGLPLPGVLLAQRGDVVACGPAIGICLGRHAAFVDRDGLGAVPIEACSMAWRV